jgi:choline-sulfatase
MTSGPLTMATAARMEAATANSEGPFDRRAADTRRCAWHSAPPRPFASSDRLADLRSLVLVAAAVAGCHDQRSERADLARPGSSEPAATLSARLLYEGKRSLTGEAQRAELFADGLVIDFGAGDQHKYVQGGWRNGWGPREAGPDGTAFAPAMARSLSLRFFLEPSHLPIRAIQMRLRARQRPRTMTISIDGAPIGSAQVVPSWTVARVPLRGRRLTPGWHQLTIAFDSQPGAVRADVDWLWLGRRGAPAPPDLSTRTGPLALGGRTFRALLAPTSRTYAFHLQPPRGAKLIFDFGGYRDTLFTVRARVDDSRYEQLFQDRATPGKWREGTVDLHRFAGQAMRLELETTGDSVSGWGDPEIMVPRTANSGLAPPVASRPRGVILLVMDTARADVFSPFNNRSRVHTPAFDRLAGRSAVFTNAYASENWTKPSVASILSGLYPSSHGAKREPDVLSRDVALLPELLQQRGFATAAFIANGYCSDKFGFRRGWATYRNYIRENRPSQAEHVFADALEWLDRHRDRPFFLYLQTIDPHVTYSPPPQHLRAYHPEPYDGPLGSTLDGYEQAAISQGKRPASAADLRWIRALYDAEISYHDEQFGRFVDALSGSRVLDETLMIVTNDHGEEIADHGRHGHGHTLYQELIRSPLLIRYPPRFKAGQVDVIVEAVDLLPTILETMGFPPRPDLDGVSLLPTLAGRPPSVPAYAMSEFLDDQRAVLVGRWKLLAGATGWRKLFDLQDDPQERNDLAARAPVARRLCEQHLAEALATPAKASRFRDVLTTPRRFQVTKVKHDPELRRQLEALGYFGAM